MSDDRTASPFGAFAGRPAVDRSAPPFGGAAGPGHARLVDRSAPPFGGAAGPGHARPVDAIEAINAEQLVTATDRLLLSGPRRRPSAPRLELVPAVAAVSAVTDEPTVFVRTRRPSLGFATRLAVVSAALGAAIGTLVVAATLLGSR